MSYRLSYQHEIRDPVHAFIGFGPSEKKVIDSQPFQRLRQIHQLALTYLVYPGATHRRFEHSLGVMEIASRIFRTVVDDRNIPDDWIRLHVLPAEDFDREYWHRAVRVAALCHDLGHLPFSHAAERELLPEGINHEDLTAAIIRSDVLSDVWQEMRVRPDDIVKLAVKPDVSGFELGGWEGILREIIVSDNFGADRIDYLLRDSLHLGVAYGRFDHYRLIDSIRILPKEEGSNEPVLGIEHGGLQSAEAMLLARYFMFSQVYFHQARRIYDIHLKDFLLSWLAEANFPTAIDEFLALDDVSVLHAISSVARGKAEGDQDAARRIVDRDHFRIVYELNPEDFKQEPEAGRVIYDAVTDEVGEEHVRWDHYRQSGEEANFPVLARQGEVRQAVAMSELLNRLPLLVTDSIFVDPAVRNPAAAAVEAARSELRSEGNHDEST